MDPALLFWLDGQQNTVKAPEREPLARVHGAVHPRPRGRLHRAGRPRGRARAHRLDPRPPGPDPPPSSPRRHDAKPKTVLGTTADLDAAALRPGPARPADLGAVRRDPVVAAPRRAEAPPAETLSRAGRRIRLEPGPHRAVPGDADRRRVCGDLRFAGRLPGRVGRRGDALPPREDRRRHRQEGGRSDARARPAAVLPAQRQRLAVRAGLAVHRVGDDPGADGGDARSGRRPPGRAGRDRRPGASTPWPTCSGSRPSRTARWPS